MPPVDPRPFASRTPTICDVCGATDFTNLTEFRGHGGSGTVWSLEVRCDLCEAVWVTHVLMRQFALDGEMRWMRRDPPPNED
jgi:hypothetical protein